MFTVYLQSHSRRTTRLKLIVRLWLKDFIKRNIDTLNLHTNQIHIKIFLTERESDNN